jgi:thiamine biosynthesis lipoprotein
MCHASLRTLAIAALFGLVVGPLAANEPELHRLRFSQVVMAVPMEIVLYAADEPTAKAAADAAFARMQQLNGVMSDYDPTSEVRRLCEASGPGNPVAVGDDLWRVLSHAQEFSAQTQGAFDITVGPVVRLWRRARRQAELPSAERIAEAKELVGYQFIRLLPEGHRVEILKKGVRIDLGGIAKSDAAKQAMAELGKRGISRAMIDAGGDLLLGDPPPGTPGWVVAITPLELDSPPIARLVLSRVSVSTSGDTWQYVEIDGRRYSHVVDPRTGMGLADHCKATVIASDPMTADVLAKAVCILGPDKGLRLVENTPGAAAFVLRSPQGKLETYQSARWKDLPKAQ